MNPFTRESAGLTDAQIEAIVAEAIAAEVSVARREAAPPSSAIVWWRAQMRARQEATRTVERSLTIAHVLAIAGGVGLLFSIGGTAAAVMGPSGWRDSVYLALAASTDSLSAIDFTSWWIAVPMTAMLISALVASIAAYLIFADE